MKILFRKTNYIIQVTVIFIMIVYNSAAIFSEDIALTQKQWYYQNNYQEDYRTLDADKIRSHWKTTSVPIPLNKIFKDISGKTKLHSGEVKNATIAVTFDFNKKEKKIPYGLHIPLIGEQFTVFLNGKPVIDTIQKSNQNNFKAKSRKNIVINLPSNLLIANENILLFHIRGNPLHEPSGLPVNGDYKIGKLEPLLKEYSGINDFALFLTLLLISFYHLLLFIKRMKDRYNLFFSILSMFTGFHFFMQTSTAIRIFENSQNAERMEYISLFFIFPLSLAFLNSIFEKKLSKLTGILSVFFGVLALPVFFMPMAWNYQIIVLCNITALLTGLYIIYYLFIAIKRRKPHSISYLAFFLVAASGVAFDYIKSTHLEATFYAYYTSFAAIVGITASLANKFLRVHNRAEELTSLLEKKVKDKTKELQEALFNVNELKLQQDGDYYLTSLLIKPLATFKAEDPPVFYQEHVEQKVQFLFKNRKVEIGGDIIITDTITLREREYSVFINGDAMGKSIQGAGGALILGVVFHSYLERTSLSYQYSDKEPERWIRDCYLDMQTVFESFDGSMLISIMLGLIDKKTGALYYINAEHPWTVLYRDNKAIFLEKELILRKIGMTIQTDRFQIRSFQLKPGDVLFTGSDGRDDILFDKNSSFKTAVMNEDETLFLKHIEYAKGNLTNITSQLHESGKITDDLTILRIEYNPDAIKKNPLDENTSNTLQELHEQKKWKDILNRLPRELKEVQIPKKNQLHFINAAIRLKEYKKAIKIGESFIEDYPINNKVLFLYFYSLKKTGKLKKAIELGEKIRLRDPYNNINLLQLADAYRRLNNIPRSKILIQEILETDPHNEKALILKKHIEKQKTDKSDLT